jgi:hypothetical protein
MINNFEPGFRPPQEFIQPQAAPGNLGFGNPMAGGNTPFYKNPTMWFALAQGLENMTMKPNRMWGQMAQYSLAQQQKDKQQKIAQDRANKTAAYFRSKGRNDLAAAIEGNPEIAGALLKEYFGSQAALRKKGFAPVFNEKTGQWMAPTYDQRTGQHAMKPIARATGLSTQEKADIATRAHVTKAEADTAQTLKAGDVKAARAFGVGFMKKAESAGNIFNKLEQMKVELTQKGADSGLVRNMLPAFSAATANLRSLANEMGIEVINSATFGALSEAELRLALTTPIDINLPRAELIKQIDSKLKAQRKLRLEFIKKASIYSSGRGLSEIIADFQAENEYQKGLMKGRRNTTAATGGGTTPGTTNRATKYPDPPLAMMSPELKAQIVKGYGLKDISQFISIWRSLTPTQQEHIWKLTQQDDGALR